MESFVSAQKQVGDHLEVTFGGILDEDSHLPELQMKNVVLNLKGINSINSVGVRNWLNWVNGLPKDSKIDLVEVPKVLVFQFNMVNGFKKDFMKVQSFFVPFYCETCDLEHEVLFTVGKEVLVKDDNIKVQFAPTDRQICKSPSCKVIIDVAEARYFSFLKK